VAAVAQPSGASAGKNTSTTFAGTVKDHAAGQLAAVAKVGSGTLTLRVTTLIPARPPSATARCKLAIGVNRRAGTLGTAGVTNDSTLIFARPDALTVTNAISGGGNLVQAGSGILTLSRQHLCRFTTVTNNGTILIGAGAQFRMERV